MNARKVPSEFTSGAWWVLAQPIWGDAKLSKSEKTAPWFLVSSWPDESSAELACQEFRRL